MLTPPHVIYISRLASMPLIAWITFCFSCAAGAGQLEILVTAAGRTDNVVRRARHNLSGDAGDHNDSKISGAAESNRIVVRRRQSEEINLQEAALIAGAGDDSTLDNISGAAGSKHIVRQRQVKRQVEEMNPLEAGLLSAAGASIKVAEDYPSAANTIQEWLGFSFLVGVVVSCCVFTACFWFRSHSVIDAHPDAPKRTSAKANFDLSLRNLLLQMEKVHSVGFFANTANTLRTIVDRRIERGCDEFDDKFDLEGMLRQYGVSPERFANGAASLSALHTETVQGTSGLFYVSEKDIAVANGDNKQTSLLADAMTESIRPGLVRVIRLLRVHIELSVEEGESEKFLSRVSQTVQRRRGSNRVSSAVPPQVEDAARADGDQYRPVATVIRMDAADIRGETEAVVETKLGWTREWQALHLTHDEMLDTNIETHESTNFRGIQTCCLVVDVNLRINPKALAHTGELESSETIKGFKVLSNYTWKDIPKVQVRSSVLDRSSYYLAAY
jgi:hypothetical protein